MSSLSDSDAAQFVQLAQTIASGNYVSVAILTLLVYAWMLTLGGEVNLYKADNLKITAAKALFAANRYIPIVYFASSFSASIALTDKSCTASALTSRTLELLQYLPWALFSARRVYAVSGRRRSAAALVLFFSSLPVALNMVHFAFDSGVVQPYFGCFDVSTVPPRLSMIFLVVSRVSLIVADVLVVGITWATMYSTMRLSSLRNGWGAAMPSFSSLLLVNGTLYFVTLAVLNTMHLVFSLCSLAASTTKLSYVVSFTEPITSILVSTFLLELHEVKRKTQHQSSDETATPRIDPVFGAIGSNLDPSEFMSPVQNRDTPGGFIDIPAVAPCHDDRSSV